MTAVLPTAVNLHTSDWDVDARARGAFAGSGEAQPAQRIVKVNGNMPISNGAAAFANTQASSSTGPLRGIYWEFLASGGYDVSSDTRVLVTNWGVNGPDQIQLTTLANDGMVFRLGSGSGNPPTNYRTWRIAGNDTFAGSAVRGPLAIAIDLDVDDHDAVIGTFDKTDVQCYGAGQVRLNLAGTKAASMVFSRIFVFTTTRGSSDIPHFTGASDWDDLVDLVNGTDYSDKIGDDWARREGNVYLFMCPIQFGDNATSTQFNDNGAIVFWPDTAQANDPRIHVTENAFRVYSNLRDNAADTLTLTGRYDGGNSYPLWDFNTSNNSSITLDGARFKRTGTFLVGSSVSGAALFNDCGVVDIVDAGADLDGSTFRNPHGTHLLRLA